MRGNSSHDSSQSCSGAHSLAWFKMRFDWPYERVVAQIEVVAPRELDTFGWAILRILDEFSDAPPSWAEMSEELGLKTDIFLKAAFDQLLQFGAVELKNPAGRHDLDNARSTDVGRELLTNGKATCLSEHHGMHLHFDAITGEHLTRLPKSVQPQPANPVIDPQSLSARIYNIGLDRIRELSLQQGEPFHTGESQICSVSVLTENGAHVWVPVRLALQIEAPGVLRACIEGASEKQQAWFDSHGWNLPRLGTLASVSTSSWANGRCGQREVPAEFDAWVGGVERLVPPETTIVQVCGLIDSASQEAILHAGWLDAKEIEPTLARATERGVRCYVCGAETSVTHWSVREGGSPGFVAAAGAADMVRPLAIVVDRSRGVRVDRLCLRTPAGTPIGAEITSVIQPAAVSSVRDALVAGVAESLGIDEIESLFARFGLTGAAPLWEQGNALILRAATGAKQVRQLSDWSVWCRQAVPDDSAARDWFTDAKRAWDLAFEAVRQGFSDELPALLDCAVRFMAPADVLGRLTAAVEDSPAGSDIARLCELLTQAGEICRRWPQFHPIKGCLRFAQALRSRLGEPADHEQVIHETMKALAVDSRFSTDGATWARMLGSAILDPADLAGLLAWLEAHVALKPQLGSSMRASAEQHLSRLAIALRAARSQGDSIVDRLQEAWEGLGLSREVLNRAQIIPQRQTALRAQHLSTKGGSL